MIIIIMIIIIMTILTTYSILGSSKMMPFTHLLFDIVPGKVWCCYGRVCSYWQPCA